MKAHPYTAKNIELQEKLDELKSGQWWLWSCIVNTPAGPREASIQGDGHGMLALETLEFDVHLKDLEGIAPDATGGIGSVEFVRKMRDEWD